MREIGLGQSRDWEDLSYCMVLAVAGSPLHMDSRDRAQRSRNRFRGSLGASPGSNSRHPPQKATPLAATGALQVSAAPLMGARKNSGCDNLPQDKSVKLRFDGLRHCPLMRRTFALLLLAAFSFPLIAPALLAGSTPELPSCCRRDGKHHCAMAAMYGLAGIPAGPGFKAIQSKCPLFPTTAVAPVFSKITVVHAAPRAYAPCVLGLTTAVPDETGFHPVSRGSAQKRGPPANPDRTKQFLF